MTDIDNYTNLVKRIETLENAVFAKKQKAHDIVVERNTKMPVFPEKARKK